MLVFTLVLLVSWFDYVNAGRTSEMRVTWEVCSNLTVLLQMCENMLAVNITGVK